MIDEATYSGLVAGIFKKLVAAADQIDPDLLDCDSTGDMVTFTARGGAKVVVNTQRAVHQIWVAGQSQGIHFSFDGQQWLDDKGRGLELLKWVSACVEAACGSALSFS